MTKVGYGLFTIVAVASSVIAIIIWLGVNYATDRN